MTKREKPKHWAESVGPYGARIRVFERERAGVLFATFTTEEGKYEQVRLAGMARPQAIAWAHEQSARMLRGEPVLRPGEIGKPGYKPTWANLFAAYAAVRTPQKSNAEQEADTRRMVFWTRVLGASNHPARLIADTWTRVQADRASGAIDALGEPVEKREDRRPVRPRTVQADFQWLHQVCRWAAVRWKDAAGKRVLDGSPTDDFDMPKDGEARQEYVSLERFTAVRQAASGIMMEDRTHGQEYRVSYLPEILDLLWLTGHRVSAVLKLRWQDVLPESSEMPHGAIKWKGENDKTGFEHTIPMTAAIRKVIDGIRRDRPGVGGAYLFPKPTTRLAPISKERVRTWLLRAEKRAGVPKQDGTLFHGYRRGWVTSRKHHPLVDLTKAGGWKRTETVSRHYMKDDTATMMRVLDEPAEIQERQA